jgi:hypothetical protein
MKLLIIAILSWMLGLAELLLPFCVADGRFDPSARVAPELPVLIAAVLFYALSNAPGLYWLRRRLEERGAHHRTLSAACALILNTPFFLLAAFLAGRTLPFERSLLFIAALVIVSLAFALGFVWSLPKHYRLAIRSLHRM